MADTVQTPPKISPCKFCGAESQFDIQHLAETEEGLPLWTVICCGCGANGPLIEPNALAALIDVEDLRSLITSIYAVDPRDLVEKGQRVSPAWFSPDCKEDVVFSNDAIGDWGNGYSSELATLEGNCADHLRAALTDKREG